MSKTKRGSKTKAKATATTKRVICDDCCSPIAEDVHEAIQCEGCCHKWYHRLCAGVSKFHYDKLADSPTPFVCWLCSESVHNAIILQIQQELAMLKKDFATKTEADRLELAKLKDENAALRASLDRLIMSAQSAGSHASSAGNCNNNRSVNPGRRKRRSQKQSRSPRTTTTTTTTTTTGTGGGASLANVAQATGNPEPGSSHQPTTRNRTQVPGSRKIWGTLKSTSTQEVSNAISSVMQMPDATFIVKRKFKIIHQSSGRNKLARWWFVVRGNEEILKLLEEKWNPDSLQVKWKLEPVFCFADAVPQPAENVQQADCESPTFPEAPPIEANITPSASSPTAPPNSSFLETSNPGVPPGQ